MAGNGESGNRTSINAAAAQEPAWQDLVSDHGFSAGYQSVRRYVYGLRGSQTPRARAIILTAPGEAQVDYGSGPMMRDPQSGKCRRTRLFVLMLGYSRMAIRLLTFGSSSRIWAQLHEKAFHRRRHDEMLAHGPWFRLWQRYGVCCPPEPSEPRLGEVEG